MGEQTTQNSSKDEQNAAYQTSADDVHADATQNKHNGETIPDKVDTSITIIDTRFGYKSCKPNCLQFMNRMGWLVLWLTLVCFLEGFAINGIANAGIPSIERHFKLNSAKSSLIPASQDIGAIVLVLFVSYIGGRYNKITWIAAGSVCMGLGSLIFTIPHMASRYHYEGDSQNNSGPTDTCGGSGPGGPPSCESDGEKWVGVFMLAQIVHGIGFTPMFTLGTVYLDENSNPQVAAIYVGICYAATAIGVATGFFAGGQIMQNYFVEFDRIDQDSLGFDAMDTRWVGAWWLGFVFTCILFVIMAIPLFGYPKYMPSNTKSAATEAALQKDKNIGCGTLCKDILTSFFKACLKLIKNPTFVFICLAGCSESLIIFGVSAFSFKYLAEMYSMGFDTAGILLGGLILVGSVGMFLGGLLIRVFKLSIVGMLRLSAAAMLISGVLGTAYMASCPEVNLAGLEVTYPNESSIDGYTVGCNNDCGCENMLFNPVCGDDNIVYYSACHAGCAVYPSAPFEPYTNCSCVASSLGLAPSMDTKATPGRCDDGCTNVRILAPCMFIMMLIVLVPTTPCSMATLRCVDDELQPLALGIAWILLRLLGSIPGPVLVGSVIDGACKMWSGSMCDSDGVCLLYNKDDLSIGVLLWWVIVNGVTAILFFIAALCAQRFIAKEASYNVSEKS